MDYYVSRPGCHTDDENNNSGKRVRALHAEIAACRHLRNKDLRGATIYVVRINKSGELMYSKPCKACSKYLKRKGIRAIYHS